MSEPLVTFENVRFAYPEAPEVIHGVSFALMPNTVTVIIGPSGCGKSTILKLAAGIERAESGMVRVPKNPCMIFQNGALLPWRTSLENVMIGLHEEGRASRKDIKRGKEALAEVGIAEFANTYPRELSGGQRQRVGIARAIVQNPTFLLLDEPFSALDAETTERLRTLIDDIAKRRGVTMLMVSHGIEDAVIMADEIIVMSKGEIAHKTKITMPRPRRRDDPAVHREVEKIKNLLAAAV